MTSKLVTIQYLRGLAALLVLLSHALLYPLAEQTLAYGRLGWMGVILFFAISGFIMVSVTDKGRFDPAQFMRRRVLRIVPLYWTFTFIAAGLTLVAPHLFKTTIFDAQQLVLSLVFVPFYNPASHGLHPLYKLGWTLNYEMFFYVCFALLAMLTARRRVIGLTLAFAGLALAGRLAAPGDAILQFYTSFMPLAFVAGAWLGLAQIEGRLALLPRPAIGLSAVIGLIGLLVGFAEQSGRVEDGLAFVGFLAFAISAMSVLVRLDAVLPRLAWLERLGDASYSIYLVHIFAVALLAGLGLRLIGADHPGAVAVVTALAVVGGVAIGLVLHRLVEKPLQRRLNAAVPAPRRVYG